MLITLHKLRPDGRHLYYDIHDRQPVLDAPYTISAAWRIDSGTGREWLHRCESLKERDELIRRLIGKRLQNGYELLYSFLRWPEVAQSHDKAAAVEESGRRREG